MIDKHAAHERILFDELCRKMRQTKPTGQILLVPYEISLLCTEAEAIEDYADNIRAMGFDFTHRNAGVSQVIFSITQIPDTLNINEASSLFAELAEKLSSVTATVESASAEFFEAKLWQSACKAAIKGGRKYDTVHLKWICDRLLVKPTEGNSVIRTCPHGRPVAFEIKKSSIERQFARVQ
jgi:DNA mismatch repair protein MutL